MPLNQIAVEVRNTRRRSNERGLSDAREAGREAKSFKIWIDLENSPHVPFFLPIIREMEARGYKVVLTARDCFQTCELADLAGLKYSKDRPSLRQESSGQT